MEKDKAVGFTKRGDREEKRNHRMPSFLSINS